MKKYRKNIQIKTIDDVIVFLRDYVDNITYGEMEEIAKDKNKLDLLEELFREFGNVLNDIDILSRRKGSEDK
jgi:hypothetical protein